MNKIRCIFRKAAGRKDLWGNPVRALLRHRSWNRFWAADGAKHVVLNNWREGISIALPNTTNAKLAYCGRHPEAPILAAFGKHLFPGAVFVDVGAHVGVYALLAARQVGANGMVLAVEPQDIGISAIKISAGLNGFEHLRIFHGVMGREAGRVDMDYETFGAVVVSQNTSWGGSRAVECWALDDLVCERGLGQVHLMKLDAGGNELSVLQGADRLLKGRLLRAVAMKLYRPEVVRQRFGHSAWDAISLLHENGYQVEVGLRGRKLALDSPEVLNSLFADGTYSHVGLATLKQERPRPGFFT